MTHLQKITTLAKKIRKQHPNKKWTDCVKAASNELKAGKSFLKQSTTKKMIGDNHQYFRTQIKLSDGNVYKVGSYSIDINTSLKKHQKLIDGYIVNMNNMTAYKTVGTKKLSGTSKKHTDTKSHNVSIKVAGIGVSDFKKKHDLIQKHVGELMGKIAYHKHMSTTDKHSKAKHNAAIKELQAKVKQHKTTIAKLKKVI